jgi:hypothetical protein
MNGICFLVSFSACSLLVYIIATDFYDTFIPLTLLNVFSQLGSFWLECLVPFKDSIISPANRDNLISSYITWIPFISFSCLTALTRNSSNILNNNGESRHSCLIPVFRVNYFKFCLFNMMSAIRLTCITFIMLKFLVFLNSSVLFPWKGVEFLSILSEI